MLENVPLLRWTGWGLLSATVMIVIYDLVEHTPVDRIYNETMARELPKRGVACHIVPRLTLDGEPISASAVRPCPTT